MDRSLGNHLTCGRGIHNAVTHKNGNAKGEVQVEWTAPDDFQGEVVFRYSALVEYDKYWVRMDTDPIVVGEGGGAGVEDAESSITFPDQETQSAGGQEDTTSQRPATTSRTTARTTQTTTTTTTTTTTKPETAAPQVNNYIPDDHEVFEGCGDARGCFGLGAFQENCIDANGKPDRCVAAVNYGPSGLDYEFKLAGKTTGYVSVGLSEDEFMGEDLTASCFSSGGLTGEVEVQAGFTVGKSHQPLTKTRKTLERLSGSVEDDLVYCTFKRPASINVEEHAMNFDLQNQE